ncbi:MAG: methylenetetrahydrofolate reductase [NAD(P)H] [Ruminococcaceae bacterium]|nr:methylenetetrahydrofolate reductase [NAD(P)H] [Oscillospiraceae bacterium]MBQ9914344.1 methylenetetrahydrofolate reductase [NAD(P)H] [Clostridia bacterium]
MKIIDIINSGKPMLSMEVFPPKTDDTFETVKEATEKIALLKPSYMSVTYGAGGGTSEYTAFIAENIEKNCGVPALAHLSCISSKKEDIRHQLDLLKSKGIENILALRGDIPEGMSREHLDYHYASELTEEIKAYGHFCIGGACYPESHPESATSFEDIEHLREKVEAGCEFLTTQMFFDNNVLYNFLYRIREAGIKVPVVAGIMPVTNPKSIKRICAISGTALPQRFVRIVDKFGSSPEQMAQAGIAYATEQIVDLYANGVNAVHLYTMNKPEVAEKIKENISFIIK